MVVEGQAPAVEHLEVLDESTGKPTGEVRPRKEVHRLGLPHRAVHSWLYCPGTKQLLLQLRATDKESWPAMWDASSAGHIVAGDTSLGTAVKEMEEEIGLSLPESAFEYIFEERVHAVLNGGAYINNEFSDVYLVTVEEPLDKAKFTLQESEVSDVKWMNWKEYRDCLLQKDPKYVPFEADGIYGQFFKALDDRDKSK